MCSSNRIRINLDQAVCLRRRRRRRSLQSEKRSLNQPHFSNESVKHKQLVDAIGDFICRGLQPLSVVDDPSFRHLLEIAEPRFKLPHRTYFTDTVIPAKYRSTRAIIENQLASVDNCVVTTDLWTSLHQQRAYISLTAHFVNNDFKHQSRCLQTLSLASPAPFPIRLLPEAGKGSGAKRRFFCCRCPPEVGTLVKN